MKLYVHLTGEGSDETTAIVNVNEAATLETVARMFLERLQRKRPDLASLPLSAVRLATDADPEAPPLAPPTAVASKLLHDKQDVFARLVRPAPPVPSQQHQESGAAATAAATTVESALKLAAAGKLREAKTFLQHILTVEPRNPDAMLHLGNILCHAGRLAEAEALLRRGVEASPERADFHVCLGDVLYERGENLAAAEHYARAVVTIQGVLGGGGSGAAAAAAAASSAAEGVKELLDAVLAKLGMALLRAGDDKKAMECFSSVLVRNRGHIPSLLGYAAVLQHRSRAAPGGDDASLTAEALQVRLHVLVANQKLQVAREAAAESLAAKTGIKALKAVLKGPASTDNAAAFAFAATVAKESGAFEQSLELYDIAIAQHPRSASYALNASHVCECLGWLGEAVTMLLRFFDANPELSVCGVSCGQISAVVKPLASASIDPHGRPAAPDTKLEPGAVEPKPLPPATPFTEDELNLIAMFFALVKLFFVIGYIQFLHPLIALTGMWFSQHRCNTICTPTHTKKEYSPSSLPQHDAERGASCI